MSGSHDLPVVYGTAACEDTAVVRARLEALEVAYRYVDVETDAGADAHVRDLAGGHRVTPLVETPAGHLIEPALDDLDALVGLAPDDRARPVATQLSGEMTARAVPLRTLPLVPDGTFSLASLRGRRQAVLFLPHAVECRACHGYAKALSRSAAAIDAAGGRFVAAVPGTPDDVASWTHEWPGGGSLVADEDAAWGARVRELLAVPEGAPAVVVLDRFLAPRALSSSSEAGGLITPVDALRWLEFLELECGTCVVPVEWSPTP